MQYVRYQIFALLLFLSFCLRAQVDSTIEILQRIPIKYLSSIENKIDKYSDRITNKTEKTLSKLSRWENKIKSVLDQVSPETSVKLFGNNQMTFNNLLKKIQEGRTVASSYRMKYNEYRDKMITSLKYLEQQKDKLNKNLLKPINDAKSKLAELEKEISNTEAVEQFIAERKRQLIEEVVKYIGKSKYLTKIDKEAYYYMETLRNYKEIFSEREKTEEVAFKILNRIPAFKKFTEENSLLASLFPKPSNYGSMAALSGLQTRSEINSVMQARIASGGPNARETLNQNMRQAQAELNKLKEKVIKAGGNNSNDAVPNFKPNQQKTKTFKQRLEYNSNFQFAKSNSYLPTTADIALGIGYKINDKSIVGIGVSYKLGFGTIQNIKISHQGVGIRSFMDWKLKKQFFVSGGYELNHNSAFKRIAELKEYNSWQSACLLGITKKINVKTKYLKGTNVSVLYDFLARRHVPTSNPVNFRIGYSF